MEINSWMGDGSSGREYGSLCEGRNFEEEVEILLLVEENQFDF